MRNQKGFTLIELLIVIGIIAILASAVIVAINPGQQFQQARNATRWSHMNSLVNAIYSATISDGGSYPTCLTDDEGVWIDATACGMNAEEGGIVPEFINSIPGDPQGETDTLSCYAIRLEDNRVSIRPANLDNFGDWGNSGTGYSEDLNNCEITDDVSDLEVIQ